MNGERKMTAGREVGTVKGRNNGKKNTGNDRVSEQ